MYFVRNKDNALDDLVIWIFVHVLKRKSQDFSWKISKTITKPHTIPPRVSQESRSPPNDITSCQYRCITATWKALSNFNSILYSNIMVKIIQQMPIDLISKFLVCAANMTLNTQSKIRVTKYYQIQSTKYIKCMQSLIHSLKLWGFDPFLIWIFDLMVFWFLWADLRAGLLGILVSAAIVQQQTVATLAATGWFEKWLWVADWLLQYLEENWTQKKEKWIVQWIQR